jgi:glycosyltransferase involved in cell wall biosynthesis
MLDRVKAALARRYEDLRRGQAFHLGPLSLVRRRHLENLLVRLSQAERQLAESGSVNALPLDVVRTRPPRDARRSVVFLHNSYYNFFYLAAALRARGWDAVSVSVEDPNGPHARFYHGEDVSLFDPDPARHQRLIEEFYATVARRFRMVHFYGRGHMSFFPESFDRHPDYDRIPGDFLRLKQQGVKIGYSVSGCLDGVAQSSVHRWSGACDRCIWQDNPVVCSDIGNLAWGHKLQTFCDLIATEGFPGLDYQNSIKCFREPLTTALDPDFWRPDLEIPDRLRLARRPGELIVYHGVGNFSTRAGKGRNLKGTGAVIDAIDRLRREGVDVRLEFVTDLPNKDVRFIQLQADVIVDQLNYGRYGATAREGMMLGKPTVCFIHPDEPPPARQLESIRTCPLVSATEATIYDVLKDLLASPERRLTLGQEGRAFAMRWHSADACAERFERVYDAMMAGESFESLGVGTDARVA